MKEGRITKLIGGLYTVEDNNKVVDVVRPRGKFRHKSLSPKVGDLVTYDEDLIYDMKDRINDLVRPPIANVDQAILVNSAKKPEFSFYLLDRFLTLIESEHIHPMIIVTKIDLLDEEELAKLKKDLAYYEQFYPVYFISKHDSKTLEPLKEIFKDKVSVLAGQTGAGKSSLLNALDVDLDLETGEISKALGRGRHTTRHTELIHVYGGLIADTPGFSKLDFMGIELEDLPNYYVDFFKLSSACKFRGCTHKNEPKCAVKKALEAGEIPALRYENYLRIFEEIESTKKRY